MARGGLAVTNTLVLYFYVYLRSLFLSLSLSLYICPLSICGHERILFLFLLTTRISKVLSLALVYTDLVYTAWAWHILGPPLPTNASAALVGWFLELVPGFRTVASSDGLHLVAS